MIRKGKLRKDWGCFYSLAETGGEVEVDDRYEEREYN